MDIKETVANTKYGNFLVYYKFDKEELKIIGVQGDSYSGLQEWTKDSGTNNNLTT